MSQLKKNARSAKMKERKMNNTIGLENILSFVRSVVISASTTIKEMRMGIGY